MSVNGLKLAARSGHWDRCRSRCRYGNLPYGVQVFFHNGTQAMYLIDEQHIVGFRVCEQTGRSPGFSITGPLVSFDTHPQFIGHDPRKGRFPNPGGREQDMIQRPPRIFAALMKILMFSMICTGLKTHPAPPAGCCSQIPGQQTLRRRDHCLNWDWP